MRATPIGSLGEALRYASFEVVTVITTNGFMIADFSLWPLALPVLLIFSGFIGGCAGSSVGGIKVIRFVVLFKQVGVHIHRLIHPQAIRRMKLDGQPVPDSVVEAVGGFFAVYVVVFVIFMALAMMDGMDQVTAFGAVAATDQQRRARARRRGGDVRRRERRRARSCSRSRCCSAGSRSSRSSCC